METTTSSTKTTTITSQLNADDIKRAIIQYADVKAEAGADTKLTWTVDHDNTPLELTIETTIISSEEPAS